MAGVDPRGHHRRQLEARQAAQARLERLDRHLSRARLAVFVAAAMLALGIIRQGELSGWWLLLPTTLFGALVVAHDRVIRSQTAVSRAVAWHQRGLDRLDDRWPGTGNEGLSFLEPDHPYASDLDLFGHGSLFQLLSTPQTSSGEETLASWLLSGADGAEVRSRQSAVRELAGRPQLCEDLFARGVDARGLDSKRIVSWATTRAVTGYASMRIVALALALMAVASVVAWGAGLVPLGAPLTCLLGNAAIGMALRRQTGSVLHHAAAPARELLLLASLVERLRAEDFAADRLRHLNARPGTDGSDPIRAARRLARIIELHDWEHNLLFAPLAAGVLWSLQCAAAVEAWRARHGTRVPGWLRAVGEVEALAALGTYAFEHPTDPFPEIVDHGDIPILEAKRLAHPLLPSGRSVANDLLLGPRPQLIVVSGSNMSGKTTLLRTVGINAVLALSGAPVRARRLRLSRVVVGSTLHVHDSLLEGRSRFYAEITRLRRLVDLARDTTPLLFLLDELFHGTNSNDRVEGAHGVLAFLLGLHAIGLVTTHDLALADIADRLGERAENVHFEDRLVDGELRFEYRIQPGRATHGNALALMRAVGLPLVPPADRA